VHTHESLGLAHAATLGDMFQDRDYLLGGQLRSEEGSPFAFGKSSFADVAVKEVVLVLFTVAVADREVFPTTDTVVGAVGILAAEAG
jgi:hypothetical protein